MSQFALGYTLAGTKIPSNQKVTMYDVAAAAHVDFNN